MSKRKKATQEDINFIRVYSSCENSLTDEEMARQLGVAIAAVP